MQTIQASEFKARCLALMDQVAASGEVAVRAICFWECAMLAE